MKLKKKRNLSPEARRRLIERNKSRQPRPNNFEHRPDGTTAIFITRRNGQQFMAIIDTTDYDFVKKFRWGIRKHGGTDQSYQVQCEHGSLRNFIFFNGTSGRDSYLMIGHKDGNKMNCRRSNLTTTTRSRQLQRQVKRNGSTPYRGVHRRGNIFVAQITFNNKSINLGRFDSDIDAAHVYDLAAIRIFGKYAGLNFPQHGARE